MDIRKLQRAIVDGLEDVKAQDIVVFNTEHLSPLFERVIIASGTSNRQAKALASSVREAVKSNGFPVLGMEGGDNGEWIIVDCGAAVAHIMQPAIREYYRLEEIWGGKSVKMKIGNDAPKGLVKAESDTPPAAKPAPAKKGAGAKKAAGTKPRPVVGELSPAKKAATSSRPPAAKKAATGSRTPAKKAVARKAPAAKQAAPERKIIVGQRPAPAKKAAPTRRPAAKSVAGKSVAGKSATGKSATGKSAAGKGAARKTNARG